MNSEGKIQRLPGLARDTKRRTSLRQLVSAQQDELETAGEKSGAVASTTTTTSTTSENVPVTLPTLPTAAIDDDDDQIRKGDRTLYSYYLGSLPLTVRWLLPFTIAIAALAERIPGDYIHAYDDVKYFANLLQ